MPTVLPNAIPEQDWMHAAPTNGYPAVAGSNGKADFIVDDEGPWRPAIDQLVAMQNLGDNWDGLGAAAPSRELVACAVGLAYVFHQRAMSPPSSVTPTTAGTIVLIWHFDDGSYGDVEIDRLFHADVTWINAGKPPEFWELPNE